MSDAPDRPADPSDRRRAPQRMTPEGLRGVAVAHLQRFPCSAEHLRRVLRRKIRRSVRHYGDDEAPLIAAAEAAVAALDGGALLDDGRYARAVADSLHRRGKSRRAIAQALRHKGVAGDDAAAALDALAEEVPGDLDLRAAVAYARRRRLGPYRRDAGRRAERREKDLAALGRQGFSYETARRVIDAQTAGELPG